MHNFELRRDRFELFRQCDNPLLNLTHTLTLPDFRPFCKARGLPPFHFFLFCILTTIETIDNFMYRLDGDEVIRIDRFQGSFTVINADGNLNFARFVMSHDLDEFVARSAEAGRIASASRALINTAADLNEREKKENIYITCMPWLDLTGIEHPIFHHAHADIPSLAWGRFSAPTGDIMQLPFSVQAHHGFVDGYHVHLLGRSIAARIAHLIDAEQTMLERIA